jgi:hypothetical protein
MWVEGEHALILVFGNGFLKDPFEGLEVQEGVDVVVDELYVLLPAGDGVLDDGDHPEH